MSRTVIVKNSSISQLQNFWSVFHMAVWTEGPFADGRFWSHEACLGRRPSNESRPSRIFLVARVKNQNQFFLNWKNGCGLIVVLVLYWSISPSTMLTSISFVSFNLWPNFQLLVVLWLHHNSRLLNCSISKVQIIKFFCWNTQKWEFYIYHLF